MSDFDELVFAGDTDGFTQDRRQLEKWREREHNGIEDTQQSEQADAVTAVLLYLADGYESGNLAERAAVALLFIRPDLIGKTSLRAMAKKLGVSVSLLSKLIRLFRETVPHIPGDTTRVQTSKARFFSLAQMRQTRRRLRLEHLQRMADARRTVRDELAKVLGEKRRIALSTLAMLDRPKVEKRILILNTLSSSLHPLDAARQMREFDEALGLTEVTK
jgi:hypothetical protein